MLFYWFKWLFARLLMKSPSEISFNCCIRSDVRGLVRRRASIKRSRYFLGIFTFSAFIHTETGNSVCDSHRYTDDSSAQRKTLWRISVCDDYADFNVIQKMIFGEGHWRLASNTQQQRSTICQDQLFRKYWVLFPIIINNWNWFDGVACYASYV